MIRLEGEQIGLELLRLWQGTWRRTEWSFVGRSLAPLTDGADRLVVSHGRPALRVGDILLVRPGGSLIAHRAVARVGEGESERWVTQGDSCLEPDLEPVPTSEVLGRVVGLVREGRYRWMHGPAWAAAGRWAAFQTRWVGRLFGRTDRPAANSKKKGIRRWVLAAHRVALRLPFGAARAAERIRRDMAHAQVHWLRSPLWRLTAAGADPETGARPGRFPLDAEEVAAGLRQAEPYGMDLLLLRRLRERSDFPPALVPERMERRQAAVAFRQLRRQPRLEEVVTALRESGVPFVALKGLAYSLTVYRGEGVREMRDVDLLVPPDREMEARNRLQDLGFQPTASPTDIDYRVHHHRAPLQDSETGIIVEIHTELVPPRVLPGGFAENVRARSVPVDLAGGEIRVPAREDLLLHLCLHLRLHRYAGCVRDVFEIAEICRWSGPPTAWERLEEAAREPNGLSTLYVGLRLARLACDAPIPDEFLEALGRKLPGRWLLREARIRFLARQLTRRPPQDRDLRITGLRWLCKQLAPL